MPRATWLARLLAVAILLAACSQSPSSGSALPSVASAAASTSEAAPLPTEGDVFPGTYQARFEPSMTFAIGDVVNIDCVPGYRCRGDVNANEKAFLDIDFGNANAPEFMVMRLDKVYDPAASGQLIDPPSDVVAMIQSAPGVTVLRSPMAVTVGGLIATQVDLWAHQPLELGPGIGFATEHETRVTVVMVKGHVVVITEQIGAQNTTRDFAAVTAGLQTLFDSIVWG